MIYERIIIGGGAAGLFCAAAAPVKNGLILEKTDRPGQKLLLSGSGQCNLTHGGSIKDFVSHYGDHGGQIRSALYKYNNLLLIKICHEHGLELTERPDGKVFPKSLQAADVLDLLLRLARENGYELRTDCQVSSLKPLADGTYLLNETDRAERVVVATGGCSYPVTGSDGKFFTVLKDLGIALSPTAPALTPIFVQAYPYRDLSGISFRNVSVTAKRKHKQIATVMGDLLLTHTGFSGPAILNLSRFVSTGDKLEINYCPGLSGNFAVAAQNKQAAGYFADTLNLPKRFFEVLLRRLDIDPGMKAVSLSGKKRKAITDMLCCDHFSISGLGSYNDAMVTRGGVALDEVNLKTFESEKYPGLYIIGEALDIDGDTGGYNLQFAFSSGYSAARR